MRGLETLHEYLQKLVGLHVQLLEQVKVEAQALAEADLRVLHESSLAKEAIIALIRIEDHRRQMIVDQLQFDGHIPRTSNTLVQIIAHLQGTAPSLAERMQSSLNTLKVMIERIQMQSRINAGVIDKSLNHVLAMKDNLLGEVQPTRTYSAKGTTNPLSATNNGPRMISKKA